MEAGIKMAEEWNDINDKVRHLEEKLRVKDEAPPNNMRLIDRILNCANLAVQGRVSRFPLASEMPIC
jgi:hypothetical protein